jgi:hypothetical protein
MLDSTTSSVQTRFCCLCWIFSFLTSSNKSRQSRYLVMPGESDECREAFGPVAIAFDQSNSEAARPSACAFSQSTKGFRSATDWLGDSIMASWSQVEGRFSVPGMCSRIRLLPCTPSGDKGQLSRDRASPMKSGWDEGIRARGDARRRPGT